MTFLDEDELAPEEPGARRYGADPQRQYLVRRVIALGVGVLILMLTISPLLAVISLLAVPASLAVTSDRAYAPTKVALRKRPRSSIGRR